MFYKDSVLPIGLLAGGIIGAGVFSLPFVFHQAGLPAGFLYLVLAAAAFAVVHLMYADIILRTSGQHRFSGYMREYLGPGFFWVGNAMAVVMMIFVLTIYLILSQSFISLILPAGVPLLKIFIFWLIGSLAIFLNLKKLALSETLITGGIVAIIGLIFLIGLPGIPAISLMPASNSYLKFLLPLPAILFALSGRVAIPALVNYCKGNVSGARQLISIKRAVIWGTLIPAIVYVLFILGVLALSGSVSEDAISGLVGRVPGVVIGAVGILGVLSLWSSYILVGLDVNDTIRYDLKFSPSSRLLIIIAAPLLLYLSGFTSFLGLVIFVGGVFGAFEGIFIVWMWLKASQKTKRPIQLFSSRHHLLSLLVGLVFLAALLGVFVRK